MSVLMTVQLRLPGAAAENADEIRWILDAAIAAAGKGNVNVSVQPHEDEPEQEGS